MKIEMEDDLNFRSLALAVEGMNWEQAKLVLEAVVASFTWKSLWKKAEFNSAMVLVLSAILAGYKPSGYHYSF